MTTVEIELDDVQMMMIEELSEDDADTDEFVSQLFSASLHNTYQQVTYE